MTHLLGKKKQRRLRSGFPAVAALPAALAVAFFLAPLVALIARVKWRDLTGLISDPIVVDALSLSLGTATVAAVISTLLGVPLAMMLVRVKFPGRTLVRALVTLPMLLPPVVAGAALLFAFGRRGSFGGPIYEATGFVTPFSIWGVIAANVFVAMPFLVVTVEGAIRGLDSEFEEAAASLGAKPRQIATGVTLPLIAPSLASGFVLAWARALGEFGATITFAGNLPGRTQTMPLAVFVALEQDRDRAVAISLVLVAVSVLVLVIARDRWWPSPKPSRDASR